ncbi:MAG: hypothetical protein ABIR70_11930 [Bryobacteraceae bacterium]
MSKSPSFGDSIEEDDEFLKAVGLIAVRASAMESTLCLFASDLLGRGDKEIGKAKIVGKRFSEIADLFEKELDTSLAAEPNWTTVWQPSMKKTVKTMKAAYELRNGVLHASFTPQVKLNEVEGERFGSRWRIVSVSSERVEGWSGARHRRELGFWSERFTLADLRAISDEIRKSDIAFFELIRALTVAFEGTFPNLARAMFSREWD